MLIRQEIPADYEKVFNLVTLSFASSAYSDGTEADYLNKIRKKATFIPELSLITETINGEIIGQIVLYQTTITATDKEYVELVLSPICVHPQYFKQGIARRMMQTAFSIAKELGYQAVFLCGDPDFYRKIGFKPTYEFDILHIKDNNAEWSMVIELNDGSLQHIIGTINTD